MKFIDAREALESLLKEHQEFISMEITINSRALKNEEAIGHPDREDFPLLRGKEVLLQAEIGDSCGQAFTSDPIAYQGLMKNILDLPADRPGNYALMVAALNALVHKLGMANHTIHCKDNEPEDCAKKISQEVLEKHGICNIGIIGYQPAILEHCAKLFGANRIHITDLNANNIGALRYGVKVLDGMTDTKQLIDFADVVLITGSILANGTYSSVLEEIVDKPFYFFGTTCAGLAYFNKSNRLCPLSK